MKNPMRRYLLTALCLAASIASAQPPANPSDTESVLLETYMHYFTVKEVLQQCGSVVPDQSGNFSKTFADWESRNRNEIALVNSAFAKHFASRSQDRQELADAAPALAHEQYLSSPYDPALCMNSLTAFNTLHLMDYALRFPEHMQILKTRLAPGTPDAAADANAGR